jgi:hypothetical protein
VPHGAIAQRPASIGHEIMAEYAALFRPTRCWNGQAIGNIGFRPQAAMARRYGVESQPALLLIMRFENVCVIMQPD